MKVETTTFVPSVGLLLMFKQHAHFTTLDKSIDPLKSKQVLTFEFEIVFITFRIDIQRKLEVEIEKHFFEDLVP